VKINQSEPFNCSEVYEIWEVDEENYENPGSYKSLRTFYCEDNNTIINLSPLDVGETKYYVVFILTRGVSCEVVEKNVKNSPVNAGENVEWKWIIRCENPTKRQLNYSVDIDMPLESFNVKLDGNAVDLKFLTIPPYGPYITVSGTLDAQSSTNHTLEFMTTPVTVEVYPPNFPSRFWVGSDALIYMQIKVRNWASEEVNHTVKRINIVYGKNVKLYRKGVLLDKKDEVRGNYTIDIYNMSGYETRTYEIYYNTPVANATMVNYRRVVLNGVQYLAYPFKVESLAPFPLDNLYIKFEHEKPFECKDVDFCWEVKEENFYNPREPYKVLDHYCENDRTVVKLSPMSIGEVKHYVCFVSESKGQYPDIVKMIYDFFEYLINLIKEFIQTLINIFKGLSL